MKNKQKPANRTWFKLDNAAKIFPAARKRNWTNVFRLSATLDEDIDVGVLKNALDILSDADRRLKSTNEEPKTVLEELILRLLRL